MDTLLSPLLLVSVLLLVLLAGIAAWVWREARRAECRFPPGGKFVEVDGVRLHYLEKGEGPPVVLIHGNGAQGQDFEACGLIEQLAGRYRVLAFDRPGFGYSTRPRRHLWTPARQARLLADACAALGADKPIILGHSFGTLVALEMAFASQLQVRGLVLVSGYYFPTARPDVWLAAAPAVPILGDILRYTVSPLFAWMSMPVILRTVFSPRPVDRGFIRLVPPSLMVRPWQLRAGAEDSACMVPAAARLSRRYERLRLPVEIVAGTADRIVHSQRKNQSGRLHARLRHSRLQILPGLGHMLHYDRADKLGAAIDRIAGGEGPTVLRRAEVPGRRPFTPRRPAAV